MRKKSLPTSEHLNVLGDKLQPCGFDPVTGFSRNGYCETGANDPAMHSVCAIMTEEFLRFSIAAGNDLSTPRPEHQFPGLKAGDAWCMCANRWAEAYHAGIAPPVVLEATHADTLQVISLDILQANALRASKLAQ